MLSKIITPLKRRFDRTSLGTGSHPEFQTLADLSLPLVRLFTLGNISEAEHPGK
jgi:hypothetical protein